MRIAVSNSSALGSASRFSDCTDICVIAEVDDCLHCYWVAEAGHCRCAFFHEFK